MNKEGKYITSYKAICKSCSSLSTLEIVHYVGKLKKKMLATYNDEICE